MKNKNILGERPRKKNNKKIDTNADVYIFSPQHGKPQPMSKVQAFIIIALTLLAFVGLFKLSQRAMDIHALNTCEQYGDCAEVIREINGR